MNHRLTQLLAPTSFDADATKIIELDVRDPISLILIQFQMTHGSVTQVAHPLACVTEVQIVDGSDVLFSLDGMEADALDWYHNGGTFRDNYNYSCTSGTPQRWFGLNFGRHLWDELLALDPSKFRNLQLKISMDMDAADASCAAYALTVWGAIFDQKVITPIGFLMAKEIKSYTNATGHEYTDLPTDHAYRKILLRALTAGTEPEAIISNFKLSEDQDKRVIFDDVPDMIQRAITPRLPEVMEHYWFSLNTSNRYLFIAPTSKVTAVGAVWATTGVAQDAAFYDGDGGRLKTIATANPSNTQIHVRGWHPHGVWDFPMGDPDEIDDWFDVSGVGSLKADITATGATGTTEIFLQQLRRY